MILILLVLFTVGVILALAYLLSNKEDPLQNVALAVFIALLITFFLWMYGYGDLLKKLFGGH